VRHLSVFSSDQDILRVMSDIHLKGTWYDLDCTFSTGVFWKGIQQPIMKSDLNPVDDSIQKASADDLWFVEDSSLRSIVFDPPFLFRNRKSVNNDKMSGRFTYFKSFDELMGMYEASVMEIAKKLSRGGYLFFKCQDMTDNKFYCTHAEILKLAKANNLTLKDIVIKVGKTKLQRDAQQQNCVAKIHSYWLVFKKTAHTTPSNQYDEIDKIVDGLVDWAESGRTKIGRPNDTLTPEEAISQLIKLMQEARVDGLLHRHLLEEGVLTSALEEDLYSLLMDVIGEDIKNKHEEVDEGCFVCNTCDHIVDPTDTDYSKDCYCDTTNKLKAEQRQKLIKLFGKEK
jgi:hypothetical protein